MKKTMLALALIAIAGTAGAQVATPPAASAGIIKAAEVVPSGVAKPQAAPPSTGSVSPPVVGSGTNAPPLVGSGKITART